MVILLSNTYGVSDDRIEIMLHPAYPISMLNLKPPTEGLKVILRSNKGT